MSQDYTDKLFMMMVSQLEYGASVALGVAENPVTKEKKKDVQQAQFFIDQLDMLKTKTKGNLTDEETRLLDACLGRLKMAFVEAGRS